MSLRNNISTSLFVSCRLVRAIAAQKLSGAILNSHSDKILEQNRKFTIFPVHCLNLNVA